MIRGAGLSGIFPVGLIGSAFKAGPLFIDPLGAAIHAVAPGAQVAVTQMEPVGGSLLLAARACGSPTAIEPDELSRLLGAAVGALT